MKEEYDVVLMPTRWVWGEVKIKIPRFVDKKLIDTTGKIEKLLEGYWYMTKAKYLVESVYIDVILKELEDKLRTEFKEINIDNVNFEYGEVRLITNKYDFMLEKDIRWDNGYKIIVEERSKYRSGEIWCSGWLDWKLSDMIILLYYVIEKFRLR